MEASKLYTRSPFAMSTSNRPVPSHTSPTRATMLMHDVFTGHNARGLVVASDGFNQRSPTLSPIPRHSFQCPLFDSSAIISDLSPLRLSRRLFLQPMGFFAQIAPLLRSRNAANVLIAQILAGCARFFP